MLLSICKIITIHDIMFYSFEIYRSLCLVFIFKTNIAFDLKHGKLNTIFSLLAFAIWVVYFDFHFSP